MGSLKAQADLGRLFLNGHGVPLDFEEGLRLLRRSALAGDTSALHTLGVACTPGSLGVMYNERRAIDYFRRVESQHEDRKCIQLGIKYKNGRAVLRNTDQAIHRFQQAADRGDAQGFRELAFCYRDGTGVEKNGRRAAELLQTAVDMGDEVSKVHLGLCFRRGEGAAAQHDRHGVVTPGVKTAVDCKFKI